MRTVADVMNLIRKLARHMQGDAPARRFQRVCIEDLHVREVLAAGQHRRGLRHRMIEDFLRIAMIRDLATIDDEQSLAEAVDFIPAVRHHDNRAIVVLEHLDKLLLHMVLQIAIERRKRFIQQNHVRLIRHDTRECYPLLLTAGELRRKPLLEPLELKLPDHLLRPCRIRASAAPEPRRNILLDGHRREERIILKQIAYPPLLRLQIDLLRAVEERPLIQPDLPLLRMDDPGDGLQRHALAGAGSPQDADALRIFFEANV